MLFDWKTDATPSLENFFEGLFTAHFKIPVSPAAFLLLAPADSKDPDLSRSGDCAIVSKISSFLLFHSSTGGWLCSECVI